MDFFNTIQWFHSKYPCDGANKSVKIFKSSNIKNRNQLKFVVKSTSNDMVTLVNLKTL